MFIVANRVLRMDDDETNFLDSMIERLGVDSPVSLEEVPSLLYELFFLPGEYLIEQILLYSPSTAAYLALSPADSRGLVAVLVSTTVWLIVLWLLFAIYKLFREIVLTIAAWIRRTCMMIVATIRAAHRLVSYRLRRLNPLNWSSRLSSAAIIENIELNDLEMAVLRSYGELPAGYAMTAVDVAAGLRVRVAAAQKTLERLKQMRLIEGTLSTRDGHEAYRSSATGRAFLDAFARTAANA